MIRRRLRERVLLSDYQQVVELVDPGASVLDLGCGEGTLLRRLIDEKHVHGNGVEIDPEAVIACIHKGLSVFHGDVDEGLADYGNASYDFVILNQTLQVILRPDFVLEEMLRVGRRAIVSFPNFGHWRVRWQLLLAGRMPRTPKLPFHWYNTPNIHLLTIRDFVEYCRRQNIHILKAVHLHQARRGQKPKRIGFGSNWRADEGLFVISRRVKP